MANKVEKTETKKVVASKNTAKKAPKKVEAKKPTKKLDTKKVEAKKEVKKLRKTVDKINAATLDSLTTEEINGL